MDEPPHLTQVTVNEQDAKIPVTYAVMTQELVKIQEHCCNLNEQVHQRIHNSETHNSLVSDSCFVRVMALEKKIKTLEYEVEKLNDHRRTLYSSLGEDNERIESLEAKYKGFSDMLENGNKSIQAHIAEQNEVLGKMLVEFATLMFFMKNEMSTATPPPTPQM